jgi:nucleoside phosphorylase
MNRPLAIIFALKAEAASLIAALDLSKIEHKTLNLYRKGNVLLVISGIGSDRARVATRECIREFSPFLIINAGSAGALGSLAKGELVEIASVTSDSDEGYLSLIDSDNAEAFSETRLVSVRNPVLDDLTRSKLSLIADCADMEGYAIAEECEHHDTECRMFKIITDSSGDTDVANIKRSIHELSATLCQSMISVIREYAVEQ